MSAETFDIPPDMRNKVALGGLDALRDLNPRLKWMKIPGFSVQTPIKAPAYPGDVGYDLAANLPNTYEGAMELLRQHKASVAIDPFMYDPTSNIYSLLPHCFMDVPVGIKAEVELARPLPDGVNLSIEVRPRSSTWRKRRLHVALGTIDVGYRGPWYFTLQNPNPFPVSIPNGEFLAQAVFELNVVPKLEEATTLTESERGEKGFGSSDLARRNQVVPRTS